MRLTADYPPVWLAGSVALAWAQARLLPLAAPPPPWTVAAGVGLSLAGIALMAAAAREFARHRTTIVPHRDATALVTTGVYRLGRNPIYLADLAILAGLALAWGAWPALALVPALAAVLEARFIRPEEARLARAFPAAFAAWSARVRRWL
ncbi:MAG: isoprenylcysteine carboxylmethyltransferase family protein [Rhodobacteraceae bacterium]|nr:isoprenylcysteine carboxylmethyltransferase family protein [Paracoccaceae bacterium]